MVLVIQDPYRVLGLVSFYILLAMALTSNDRAVRKLGKNWKRLHNLIYVVLVLILIHGFNLGAVFFRVEALAYIAVAAGIILILMKVPQKFRRKSLS